MNTDPIADMLTRIRNALYRKFDTIELPASKIKQAIASILVEHGYLKKYELVDSKTGHNNLLLTLKYYGDHPIINGLKRISKPGQRIYLNKSSLSKILSSQIEEVIVSTSKGLMTGRNALKDGLGGEILFKIWFCISFSN